MRTCVYFLYPVLKNIDAMPGTLDGRIDTSLIYFKIYIYIFFKTGYFYIRAHESAIIQLIRRRVLFSGLFHHKIAENGLQDLKMVQKDASSHSTQSVIKISP
jgi:hypothetical protein